MTVATDQKNIKLAQDVERIRQLVAGYELEGKTYLYNRTLSEDDSYRHRRSAEKDLLTLNEARQVRAIENPEEFAQLQDGLKAIAHTYLNVELSYGVVAIEEYVATAAAHPQGVEGFARDQALIRLSQQASIVGDVQTLKTPVDKGKEIFTLVTETHVPQATLLLRAHNEKVIDKDTYVRLNNGINAIQTAMKPYQVISDADLRQNLIAACHVANEANHAAKQPAYRAAVANVAAITAAVEGYETDKNPYLHAQSQLRNERLSETLARVAVGTLDVPAARAEILANQSPLANGQVLLLEAQQLDVVEGHVYKDLRDRFAAVEATFNKLIPLPESLDRELASARRTFEGSQQQTQEFEGLEPKL